MKKMAKSLKNFFTKKFTRRNKVKFNKSISILLILTFLFTGVFTNLSLPKKVYANDNTFTQEDNIEFIKEKRRNLLNENPNLNLHVDDPINIDESGLCVGGNHRCMIKYVSTTGDVIEYYRFCVDCNFQKYVTLTEGHYDTLEKRIDIVKHGDESVKKFFDERGLDYTAKEEVNPDIINKIKENRKFVLDNGIFVKKDGQNITASSSVNDSIDVNSKGICKDNNHERTYAHYAYEGSKFYVRKGCFDCLQEEHTLISKEEYDTLDERIKLANTSERAKNFFIENGLSYQAIERVKTPENLKITKSLNFKKSKSYCINYYSNNVVEIISDLSGKIHVFLCDIDTGNMELKIIGDDKIISINSRKLTVGRLSTNNIHLTNRSISRKHCLIEVIDKYVYLVDLGSKFGTYLNDRKLIEGERVLITSNDIISIGMGNETVKFIYKVGEKDIDER